MIRLFTTAALTFALGATALSPSVAQNADQRGPMAGMMGGGCPMIGMMGQGMMGPGMMGPVGPGHDGGPPSQDGRHGRRSSCLSERRTQHH